MLISVYVANFSYFLGNDIDPTSLISYHGEPRADSTGHGFDSHMESGLRETGDLKRQFIWHSDCSYKPMLSCYP